MHKDKVGKGREEKEIKGKERGGLERDKCVICYPIVDTLPVNRFQPNLVGRCRSPT